MNVQSPLRRAPQGVVGACVWRRTGRHGVQWPHASPGGRATCWMGVADGPSGMTVRSWWDGSVRGSTRSGRRADGAGDPPPRREPGERRGHVQNDSSDRALDPHGELEQPLAQRRNLCISTGGARRPAPQVLEQHIRRQREQDPELVGPEVLATGPVHLQSMMQFLEPVLDVPAPAVELVDRRRLVAQVGHHEARVVLRIAPRMAHHLGLDNHPPFALPRPGRVARLPIQMRRLARTWQRKRRVIIKAEVVRHPGRDPKNNPRFVVTNLGDEPAAVYQFYCGRGDVENRLKELHHGLEMDRTSCEHFRANQFRVLLTLAAYVLFQDLRRRAAGTACADAQVTTLRERLLKLAVWVERSVRRIVLHMPATFPWLPTWRRIARAVGATP